MKTMFNDFEDKSSSKTDNMDDIMDTLNSRLQGIESGEKLQNQVTREDFDQALKDMKNSMEKNTEHFNKIQSNGSEKYENKIESQKIEQDKTNKNLQDKIKELMEQMNSRMGQIDNLVSKSAQMELLASKLNDIEDNGKLMQEKLTKSEEQSKKLMTDLKKCETSMDNSAKTLKRLSVIAGISDEDPNDPSSHLGFAGGFGNGNGNGSSSGVSGMTPSELKKLTESLTKFDNGSYVTIEEFSVK